MNTKNLQICLVVYFQNYRQLNWAEQFQGFAKAIAKDLNTSLTHFSCKHIDTVKYLKSDHVYCCEPPHTTLLEDLLVNRQEKVKNVYYHISPSTDLFHDAEITICLDNDQTYRPYRRLYVDLPLSRLLSWRSQISQWIVNMDNLVSIQYGLVTTMLREKIPAIYFSDMQLSNLSKEEMFNLGLWRKQRQYYAYKVRSVYWGNILGIEHLNVVQSKESFWESLKDCVGNQNIIRLPSGDILFFVSDMPENASTSSFTAVRQLLVDYNLLIEATGEGYLPGIYSQQS